MATLLELEDLRGLHGRISLDVETVGGHAPHLGDLVGTSVWAPDAGVMGYLPGDHWKAFRRLMMRTWEPGSWLIAHNLKYEARWLGLSETDLDRFRLFDTAVAEHLIDENLVKDLGSVELRRLGTQTKANYMVLAKKKGLKIADVTAWPLALLSDYCLNDCRITFEIAKRQGPLLREEGADKLFMRLMSYLRLIHGAEQTGMLIDEERLDWTDHQLRVGIDLEQAEWAELLTEYGVTKAVNHRSPQQLSKLLYEDLGIPKPEMPEELRNSPKANKYTKTATSKELLQGLRHPVATKVLRIKKLVKVQGYVQSYRDLGEPTSGGIVVHPDFNITGTVTGRLSCSNPNLQQVPGEALDTAVGAIGVREIFRARPGYDLVSIDYQQMEAVVFGILARDPTMIKLIRQGGDIHVATAKLLFGEYNKDRRRVVKTLNFGLLYGLGRPGLAEMLGVDLETSNRLMEGYLRLFPRARPFMGEVAAQLGRRGFVRYWSGRKRRIKNPKQHYKGVNSVIQGGCADVLAEAVIRVDRVIRPQGGYLISFVHDELLMEIPTEVNKDPTLLVDIQKAMSMEDAFGIALGTDPKIGSHWASKT